MPKTVAGKPMAPYPSGFSMRLYSLLPSSDLLYPTTL